MKIKEEQLQKLAELIYEKLAKDKLITILSDRQTIVDKAAGILIADAKKEQEINDEAEAMMDKFKKQVESGEVDYQKMFQMIKKQLIKDKNFII